MFFFHDSTLLAKERWATQTDVADEFNWYRLISAVERRILRQSRIPQSRVHAGHQRLCPRPYQTATTTLPQPLVNQGTPLNK